MPEPSSRSRLIVWGLVLVAALVLGARSLDRGDASAAPALPAIAVTDPGTSGAAGSAGNEPSEAAPPAGRVTVHVAGAVRAPGLYRLTQGARVDDAVRRAGGPTRRADLGAVNLAALAEDGQQILIPVRTRPPVSAGPTGTAPTTVSPTTPVNLNTATLEELDTLDGVGPATAQNIIDYREANGGFSSVDELDLVSGIGEKRLAALRDQVTL